LKPVSYADGIFFEKDRFYTASLAPGYSVYGERTNKLKGIEYRRWNPRRSKLSAYLSKGGRNVPFQRKSNVLYLGASTGTTVSHISDIVSKGRIFAVEFSERSFRDLLNMAVRRPNVLPLLEDARHPEHYSAAMGVVDILYQDVSQRDQVDIFLNNSALLKPGGMGILALKARSIDVSLSPKKIYQDALNDISASGFQLLDLIELDPFQKDHGFFVFKKRGGP